VNRTWPLPALLAWGACWTLFGLLRSVNAPLAAAIVAGAAAGAVASVIGHTPWRRLFIALGFPLSLAASGLAAALPAWGWLLPLALLAGVYPLNAWRDAPLFPTPRGALRGLATLVPLARGPSDAPDAPDARAPSVLDAGCGLGAGLRELRDEYPAAALQGLEWSWPLRVLCGWRCPFASVRRGDIWAADWSGFDMVYVFQRPESMARAADKAARELRPGAWLASLEFAVPGLAPTRELACDDGRRVWLYRAPLAARCSAM
jgi:SAM-dependent methyltransferase